MNNAIKKKVKKENQALNTFQNTPLKWDFWVSKKIIAELQTNINSVLNKLQLKPTVTASAFLQKTKGYKHRYYTECFDSKGNKYFFYALLKNDELSKKSFEKEINFAAFTINHHFSLKEILPQYIKCSNKDSVPWILLKYIPVLPLESKTKMERLTNEISIETASSIAKQLFNINFHFLTTIQGRIPLNYFDVKREIQEKMKNLLAQFEALGHIDSASCIMAKTFIANHYDLLAEENKYFTHGDFHMGNIFLQHVKEINMIKITDWETYQLNNFGFDIAYLFTRLSQEPEARNNILSAYLKLIPEDKRERFKILFRLNVLYFAIKDGILASYLELTEKEVEDRQRWFKNLFLKSLSSFEEIIRL